MNAIPDQLECERLLLRRWRPSDRRPFAAMNADPRVMEYFPETLSVGDSDALFERIQRHFDIHGYGLWAVEEKDGAPFIGFIGLAIPRFESHFTPCVEVGWRLDSNHWGQGYATEGAIAVLKFGFQHLRLQEIVSMTTVANIRSRRVMEKIGMLRSPADDFDHPLLPNGHPLQRHVLYRTRTKKERDVAGDLASVLIENSKSNPPAAGTGAFGES